MAADSAWQSDYPVHSLSVLKLQLRLKGKEASLNVFRLSLLGLKAQVKAWGSENFSPYLWFTSGDSLCLRFPSHQCSFFAAVSWHPFARHRAHGRTGVCQETFSRVADCTSTAWEVSCFPQESLLQCKAANGITATLAAHQRLGAEPSSQISSSSCDCSHQLLSAVGSPIRLSGLLRLLISGLRFLCAEFNQFSGK